MSFSSSSFSAKNEKKKAVKMESISLKYEGETKKGLAHGDGKAWGEADQYVGTFKKGYPNGTGVYTWGNGNVYTGEFSKGQRDGKGEFRIKRGGNLPDSIQTGYFKDDQYIGIYKEPYKIVSEGGVRNVDFQKNAGALNQVRFEVYSNGSPVPTSLLKVSDKNNTLHEEIGGTLTLTNAVFPLERVEVSFRVDKISYNLIFNLYEQGNWTVVITV